MSHCSFLVTDSVKKRSQAESLLDIVWKCRIQLRLSEPEGFQNGWQNSSPITNSPCPPLPLSQDTVYGNERAAGSHLSQQTSACWMDFIRAYGHSAVVWNNIVSWLNNGLLGCAIHAANLETIST